MTERKWQERRSPYTTPRYIVFSLIGTACLALAMLGYMSGKSNEFGQLLGGYQDLVHANWQYLAMFGLFVGVSNFLIAFSNR